MTNSIKETSVQTQRKFDPAFKRQAVAHWLSSGKTARVIAEELGIKRGRLYNWKAAIEPVEAGGEASGGTQDLATQLEAAQREIRHLREQRDILKKTLGILSEPSMSATSGSMR